MIRNYRPILERLDLTYPQYLVMLSLWEEDGIRINQLSQKVRLDAGTLTPLLKRLETKGLLDRQRSEGDERARILVLTPAGKALEAQAQSIPDEMLCKVKMSGDELARLKALTEQVWERLN
jgi:DNA-binding MarR family transcriptional regulator